MSRTPARVTQADIARTIRAARQAGARTVEVKFPDGTTLSVKLDDSAEITGGPLAAQREIVL
jgi:diphthamide synthase subunit DPH2